MSSEPNKEYVIEEYQNQEHVPVPDWHLAIIEERMARYRTEDKTKWRTWEEVEKELMQEIIEEMKEKKANYRLDPHLQHNELSIRPLTGR